LRAGVRADALYYDVNDRLGNFAPLTRPQDTYIVGFRRSAFGLAWGPRASAEVHPTSALALRAAYGEGYRSPQARTLDDGEEAPFSKVRSADLGARLSWDARYQLTLAAYYTHLSDDVAFDAEEGRLERIGQTRRVGAVIDVRAQPLDGLVGALSLTFVDAELLEPPPPTPEEPEPPFRAGQNLPFVPPIVVRLDLGARSLEMGSVGPRKLVGRAGAGFSFLSARPLPFGQFADPVALLDTAAGLAWGPLDLGLELFNLFDARYAASEFFFASSWDPESPRTRVPVRHVAAGAPFTWLVTLGLTL
jgi:outer membrane receptor protein involved in Fe transport